MAGGTKTSRRRMKKLLNKMGKREEIKNLLLCTPEYTPTYITEKVFDNLAVTVHSAKCMAL